MYKVSFLITEVHLALKNEHSIVMRNSTVLQNYYNVLCSIFLYVYLQIKTRVDTFCTSIKRTITKNNKSKVSFNVKIFLSYIHIADYKCINVTGIFMLLQL